MPRNPAKKNLHPKPVRSPVNKTGLRDSPGHELIERLQNPKPIEEDSSALESVSIKKEPPAPPVQVIERLIETVTVEIPLGEPPRRFDRAHIEVLLMGDHAHTWARLRQALRDKDARTANGREVKSGPDILRWLLEQFASC